MARHFNGGSGNPILDSIVNNPTADIREACGDINSAAGIFAPVTSLLTMLFRNSRLTDFPHLFRPEDADPFNWSGVIVLPAPPAIPLGVFTPVLTFKMPTGYNGVIKRLVNYITTGFLEGSGAVVWALFEGPRPIKNFGNILTTQGSLQTPWPVDGIRLRADQTYTFSVQNNTVPGAGIQAICIVAGYYWPQGRKR